MAGKSGKIADGKNNENAAILAKYEIVDTPDRIIFVVAHRLQSKRAGAIAFCDLLRRARAVKPRGGPFQLRLKPRPPSRTKAAFIPLTTDFALRQKHLADGLHLGKPVEDEPSRLTTAQVAFRFCRGLLLHNQRLPRRTSRPVVPTASGLPSNGPAGATVQARSSSPSWPSDSRSFGWRGFIRSILIECASRVRCAPGATPRSKTRHQRGLHRSLQPASRIPDG
jgi:hypothetical protein